MRTSFSNLSVIRFLVVPFCMAGGSDVLFAQTVVPGTGQRVEDASDDFEAEGD